MMPFELGEAVDSFHFITPGRPLGFALLILYGAVFVYLLLRQGPALLQLSRRQVAITSGIWIAAIVASQIFPFDSPFATLWARLSGSPEVVVPLAVFTAVPFLLAGAILNPAVALFAGLYTGLGLSLWQTHSYFDIFHLGFVAWFAAFLMHQPYSGRLYRWLRNPAVSGVVAMILGAMLTGLSTFASVNAGTGNAAALDLALSTAGVRLSSMLLEGLLAGLGIALLLRWVPSLQPQFALKPSPEQRSLSRTLLFTFVRFATLLTLTLLATVYFLSARVATKLVTSQMIHDANTVSQQIPAFQQSLQNILVQYGNDDSLLSQSSVAQNQSLKQLQRAGPNFRQLLLVDHNRSILAAYPADEPVELTKLERAAIDNSLRSGEPDMTSTEGSIDSHVLSFVVPVLNGAEPSTAVLIGRVPDFTLNSLIVGLQGTVGEGSGFIVDSSARVIAHPDENRLGTFWYAPVPDAVIGSQSAIAGVEYLGRRGDTLARELVYYVSSAEHPWTVVITLPYQIVLSLALSIGTPLAGVLLVFMSLFYVNLNQVGKSVTDPLSKLVKATTSIVDDRLELDRELIFDREDEVGQLSKAFARMQRHLKGRLDAQSLLLGVSHEASASIDMSQGMPAILKGALRGTGAAGARAIVFNPSGGAPLTYQEGPAGASLADFDYALVRRMRSIRQLALPTPAALRAELEVSSEDQIPVPALFSISLQKGERPLGVLCLGFREPKQFSEDDHKLLQMLAVQASSMVENARLFATADSGWRRMVAVLNSTTDAVIVTDRTNRILMINRTMERTFTLSSRDVLSRQVTDVISLQPLVRALTATDEGWQHQELIHEERAYYINANPIVGKDGEAMGRVAVMHDITHFKELDELKTDFVSTVSHDLRSPLTFMRGYTTMLPMVGEVNDKQQQYIQKILNGINQMSELVDGLLDLSRIDAGIEVNLEKVELKPLLTDLVQEYWQHSYQKGIRLEADIPGNLPLVLGDEALIRQAIANYIGNGNKYAPKSGRMILRAEIADGEVIISLKDRGPGIPPEAQMRLFEKFYRARQPGTENVKGSGLGLAIVKSIADLLGGRAWCRSEVGKGSIFFFSIPIAK